MLRGKFESTNRKHYSDLGNDHPRRPRGSQSDRKKRRDESFQPWAEEPLGTDSHRTISNGQGNAGSQLGTKKYFVLLCPIGEQFLPSSFREFVHDIYYLATITRFVHQAFVTRNEGTTDESKNVSDVEGLNVINGPKCNKVLNVITFCPKCNKLLSSQLQ